MVWVAGLEPAASWTQITPSANWRTPRYIIWLSRPALLFIVILNGQLCIYRSHIRTYSVANYRPLLRTKLIFRYSTEWLAASLQGFIFEPYLSFDRWNFQMGIGRMVGFEPTTKCVSLHIPLRGKKLYPLSYILHIYQPLCIAMVVFLF